MSEQSHRTERALLESRERYESLKKYNPNGICSFDLNGQIIGANPAYEQLTGYSLAELRTLDVRAAQLHPPELQQTQGTVLNRHMRDVRTVIRHKGGQVIHVSATTVPIIIDGKTIGTYLILQDLTRLEQAQEQLRQTEERYRRLVDNSLDAVGIIEQGMWTYINPAGYRMFGATCPEEIVGSRYMAYLHPEHHEESKQRAAAVFAGQSLDFVEYKFYKLNGEMFHAEVLGIPFGANSLQVIMCDLTERKAAEQLLVQSEKLSAVGQLAAGVAHEIRNPLTALNRVCSDDARYGVCRC